MACVLPGFEADRLTSWEREGCGSELGEPVTIQGLEVDMHNGTVVQVSPIGYRSPFLTFP